MSVRIESVIRLFERAADQFGDAIAIDSAALSMTYRELETRANHLANRLLESGAVKESIVAILTDDVPDVIMTILGALKAGCAFAPIDPALPEKRIGAMMAEIAPDWLVTDTQTLAKIAPSLRQAAEQAQVIALDQLDQGEKPAEYDGTLTYLNGSDRPLNPARPQVDLSPDEMNYIYFTSGSTGKPKGIAGRRRGLAHFVRWEIETFGIGPGSRVSQLTTPSFDPFLRDIFVPLCAGGTVCIPDNAETLLDPRRLITWLDQQQVTLIHCVPSLFRLMLNEPLDASHFPALQYILLAGEALLPSDVKRWLDVFETRVQLVNLLGPSETTLAKFCYFVQPDDVNRRTIPIGKPIKGTAAMILNQQGQLCPPRTIGEIYIRTPFRSLGYYQQPALTQEVFVPNPFNDDPNDLLYKTGDLGRILEDGNFEFLGRMDFQVKIRGLRVELVAIENLLRAHPVIDDVVVTAREDTLGNAYLCAYLVANQGVEPQALTAYLSNDLPAYMIPSAYLFLDGLPRNLNGKVNRRALPAPDQLQPKETFVAPRTPVEEKVAGIWANLLNLQQVGVADNFFESGGHSLLATQVLARISEAFEVEVPLRSFFETPTVAGVAAYIEGQQGRANGANVQAITPLSRSAPLPLSFAQQRLWFLDQLEPNSPSYNIFAAVQLAGQLNLKALEQAFGEIVQRHEILRTTFVAVDGKAVQVIQEQGLEIPLVDLTDSAGPDQQPEIERRIAAEAETPFDLATGPLLRVTVLRLSAADHIVMITMHHIISDVWSIGLLIREFSTLYPAFATGDPSPLPNLPIQYADFAGWQRGWLQGDVWAQELTYWKEQLGTNLPIVALPTDRPRPEVQTYRGARQPFSFSQSLSERLHRLSLDQGATLFMTLLTGFNLLLYRYTGQADLVVGTDVANRNRTQTENLIGFFVNQLTLRTDLSGNPTFLALLNRVKEVTLGAYAHQDMPFDQLVSALKPKRDPAFPPLFQVKMILQNVPIPEMTLPDLTLRPLKTYNETSKYDLLVEFWTTGQTIQGELEYNPDLFNPATIEQMVQHLETIFSTAVAEPEISVAGLVDTLNEAEAQQQTEKRTERQADSRRKIRQAKRRSVQIASGKEVI